MVFLQLNINLLTVVVAVDPPHCRPLPLEKHRSRTTAVLLPIWTWSLESWMDAMVKNRGAAEQIFVAILLLDCSGRETAIEGKESDENESRDIQRGGGGLSVAGRQHTPRLLRAASVFSLSDLHAAQICMIGWATPKLPSTTSHRHCFAETSAAVAGEPSSSSREIWCRKLGNR
nr:hypothetical protein Iba_chr09cCG8440 [Ipomoea batatas]